MKETPGGVVTSIIACAILASLWLAVCVFALLIALAMLSQFGIQAGENPGDPGRQRLSNLVVVGVLLGSGLLAIWGIARIAGSRDGTVTPRHARRGPGRRSR